MNEKAMRDKLTTIINKSFEKQYEERGLLTAPHTVDDLIANGFILPPCKVGDKVWWLTTANWQGTKWKIEEVRVSMLQQKADKSWKIRLTHNSSVFDITTDKIGIAI